MKLSISNIAWSAQFDEKMYYFFKEAGFAGLEIAPTRIFPERPYDRLTEAAAFAGKLKSEYGICVSSMQSIWYGKSERLFGNTEDKATLAAYTRQAVDFAAVLGCGNLVFGCPKNRILPEGAVPDEGLAFFEEIGEYAAQKGTVIALEPNPVIYGTNFVNTTIEAFDFVRKADCSGLLVNVDLGTVLYNNECLQTIEDNLALVNHIHISEPNLEQVQRRELHKELADILRNSDYQKFVSIEMKNLKNIEAVKESMLYINEVFS